MWVLYLIDSSCLYPLPATPSYPLFGAFLAQILLKFLGNSAEALRSKAQSGGSYFTTVTVPLPIFRLADYTDKWFRAISTAPPPTFMIPPTRRPALSSPFFARSRARLRAEILRTSPGITFDGFRSRCVMSSSCALSSAPAICAPYLKNVPRERRL